MFPARAAARGAGARKASQTRLGRKRREALRAYPRHATPVAKHPRLPTDRTLLNICLLTLIPHVISATEHV